MAADPITEFKIGEASDASIAKRGERPSLITAAEFRMSDGGILSGIRIGASHAGVWTKWRLIIEGKKRRMRLH